MIDRITRFGWLVAAGALLSGCSWTGSLFTSDKVAYETAQTRAAPLEVPPDLSQLPRDERFVIPDRPQTVTASQGMRPGVPAPAAVGASVAPASVVAKIERQGNQRWLAVNLPPERAWPVLVEFWPSIGMKVEKSDPAAGVMETAWAENRAKLPQDIIRKTLGRILDTLYSTGEQDKYRARIERTSENTSEIYISHRGMVEVYTSPAQDQTRWQPRPSDPELEAEVLQRLAVRFDGASARATTTAAAPSGGPAAAPGAAAVQGSATVAPAAPQVARVVKGPDGRSEWLEIDETFDRAWRRVGLALDRGAFTVEDRDRGKGIYFVRYLDPEYEAKAKGEQGFFTKLFSREKPVQAPQFRVVVTNQGPGKTFVTVENAEGKPERSVAGDRILNLVNEQLR